ncbi:SDR family NAD(P)-dependent oxidoreductase [Vreelandella populi]|uniref:SDR family NAD(P)-dependent oxidoreductase n=1 Tax=Vreelandella populi TaxID=2498858 RepID=A0A3S0ZBZ9_9GAMM|nr:SDR family NAD(P)-dependent oxidoreductase [Halomonas populi]RUR43426.1 SDR family NAD(P)-dependent oxidoreductase [Halomonas populi]
MYLDKKVALITGAAGGIGQAIAELYARNGARLMLADRDSVRLVEFANRLRHEYGVEARCYALDVTEEESVQALVCETEKVFGGIDILVTSAGAISEYPIEEMSLTAWRHVMTCNLDAVFLACRAVLPVMRRQGQGRIINISSQIGQRGAPRFTHYAASKAGVIALTKSLSREVAREGILVNSIAPGPVLTEFNRNLRPETLAGTEDALPLGRAARPEEVAGSALLLASSPHGDVFVGQTLCPNSGDVML